MKYIFLFISFFFFSLLIHAQQIKLLTDSAKISLRGLSVVNDNIIWASGSKGKVARSTDGGNNFEWLTVKGYEQKDFRDIEAFDANTALIMVVDTPAVILKTKDGGKTWKEVFHNDTKGMFLDAMDFYNNKIGMVVGDPVDGYFFMAKTEDGGANWKILDTVQLSDYRYNRCKAFDGEAFFAASGSNIKMMDTANYIMVTGGKYSRIINSEGIGTTFSKGSETSGANSIAVQKTDKNFVVVGGDFSNDTSRQYNCIIGHLPLTDYLVQTSPHGYRSCVVYITKEKLICCGTSGIDISTDGGLNWHLISNESFHVCAKAKKGSAVFLAGKDGRIAKLIE